MKKLLLPLIFMTLAITLPGQSDTEAIASAVDKLHQAIIDGDSDKLHAITTKELTYGHSSGSIENRQEFIEALTSGKSDFAKIEMSDEVIMLKGNTAWVRFIMDADVISDGNTTPITLKILYIWVQDGGEWKLLARQAVR